MAFSEDLTHWADSTHLLPFRSLMAPTAVPMFRLENDTMTNQVFRVVQVFMQDYVEKNGGFIMALLGEDPFILGQYFYQGWYLNLFLMGYHAQTSSTTATFSMRTRTSRRRTTRASTRSRTTSTRRHRFD